jgi:hypothetical protein
LARIEHSDKIEAREAFQEVLDKACLENKWAAAVWTVGDDGVVTLERVTTNSFPHASMDAAVDLLKKSFVEQQFPTAPDPLPVADFLTRVFHPSDNLE